MAGPVVLVDTSVLIDYFRKKDKGRTLLHQLAEDGCTLKLSVITEYEVYVGATRASSRIGAECLSTLRCCHSDQGKYAGQQRPRPN